MQHFYVYSYREWGLKGTTRQPGEALGSAGYVYERTCGTEEAAKERVKEYGSRAVYLVNHLIRGAYY